MSVLQHLFSRPIATLMGWTAVVLLGLISWQKLPVELLPELEYPQITVVLRYANASPEEVENLLVKPIESAVSGVQRLVRLESRCREGAGFIHAFFDWGTSMDFAALSVREKIDLIRDKFPREADAPIVMKYSPFALPTMILAVTGDTPAQTLLDYARHTLKNQLGKVDGVAEVQIRGGQEQEIRVEIRGSQLLSSGRSLLSVAQGLRDANINYPAGSIESKSNEYLLRTMGEFKELQEIAELPLSEGLPAPEEAVPILERPSLGAFRATMEDAREGQAPSQTISDFSSQKIKNIARVFSAPQERTSYSRHNGLENISVAIYKQSGVPTTLVVGRIQRAFREIQRQAPAGITLETVYDQSGYIRSAFRSVGEALVLGAILTFAVLFYFLRNLKYALVIFLSIPCCLLGTALAMYFSGVSFNMISLGGLALAIGMLVDNSIVVIENIHRHAQLGESPMDAAVHGTHEVLGAVSSSTFAHIVVFLPMIYLTGVAGQIIRDMAITVSFGLLFSLATSLTLTPLFMLRSTKVRSHPREIHFSYTSLEEIYARLFAQKKRVFWGCAGAFALGALILLVLPKELLPKINARQWTIQATLPVGTTVATTNERLSGLEKYLLSLPYVQSVSLLIGAQKDSDIAETLAALRANEGEFLIELKGRSDKNPDRVMADIAGWLKEHPVAGLSLRYDLQRGLMAIGSGPTGTGGTAIVLQGDDLGAVAKTIDRVVGQLQAVRGLSQIHSSLMMGSPEAKLSVSRKLASAYNVSVKDIAGTMKIAVEGVVPTTFKGGPHPIDIRVSLVPEEAKNFLALGEIRIPTAEPGASVPLKKMAQLVRSSGPLEILRHDKQRTAIVSFASDSRWAQRRALRAMRKLSPEPAITLGLEGERQILLPALRELFFALGLSLLLLFMILAAQFESLFQPFLILFTVPLSILGVALALLFTGQSLNAVCMLGIVVMGGIVVNNGILYITIANQLLRTGSMPVQAAIKAAHLRLRPILMTSATTVLGMLPMAMGIGEGSQLNAPLAIVVIGGMLSSTPLVLGLLPCLFSSLPIPFARGGNESA